MRRTRFFLISAILFRAPFLFGANPDSEECRWDLTELYKTSQDWDQRAKMFLSQVSQLQNFKGRLDNPRALQAALHLYFDLSKDVSRLSSYANNKSNEDQQIAENLERAGEASVLVSKLGAAASFLSPEIISLGANKISELIDENAELKTFEFFLNDTVRLAPHTLGPEAESVLAATGAILSAPESTYEVLRSTEIEWPTIELANHEKIQVTTHNYETLRTSVNREDRKKAYDAYYATLKKYERTMGSVLYSFLLGANFESSSRKYPQSLNGSLSEHNIPEAVFRTLIDETHKGFPALDRYEKLRARMLGITDLKYYDLYTPFLEVKQEYPIEKAKDIVLTSVAPLGDDYVKIMKEILYNRWIDVYNRKGKRDGAYMDGGAYDAHPFILLNHDNALEGTETLTHEAGHAAYAVITKKNQPYHYSDNSLSIDEIASQANELLLQDYLLKNAKTREEKIFLLTTAVERIRQSFFRQVQFSEFELKVHEAVGNGEVISGEKASEIYLDLLKTYYGHDRGVVTIDDAYALEWAQVPHFYYNFYVYQYATSLAAATYFIDQIIEGKPGAQENYLKILRAGASDYPTNILLRAGLDMTSPAPYQALIRRMNSLLDQLDELTAVPATPPVETK